MERIGKILDIFKELNSLYKGGELDKEKEYKLTLTEFKGDRNTKQNALYNSTLYEIQKKTSQSLMLTRDELHNMLLGEMGLIERDSEGEPKIELHSENYQYLKDSTTHLKPTNTIITDKKGGKRRVFYVLRESKTFTTEEFAKLIDRLITFILDNGLQDKIDTSHLQDIIKGEK